MQKYWVRLCKQAVPSTFLISMILLICLSVYSQVERINIGQFSSGSLDGWNNKSFAGETDYRIISDHEQKILQAKSQSSASGLYREIDIDLTRTPYLNWSWRIGNVFNDDNERTKAGDDYPARIYVVFSEGLMFWRTKAINYVWSSNQPKGSEWPNAFTGNARMIAVQSGDEALGTWVHEKRDVRADYQRLFGKKPGKVSAVALMTDTDNTGLKATAWYGDIWFSAQ